MSETARNAPLFKADSVMLGLSAQKSEDSPIKADRLRVTYVGWDDLNCRSLIAVCHEDRWLHPAVTCRKTALALVGPGILAQT
jgi:hypothetical protein